MRTRSVTIGSLVLPVLLETGQLDGHPHGRRLTKSSVSAGGPPCIVCYKNDACCFERVWADAATMNTPAPARSATIAKLRDRFRDLGWPLSEHVTELVTKLVRSG
jgi:hypothetical protein